MELRITSNIDELAGRLADLGPKAARAQMRALNRTIEQVRTAATREIAADVGLTQGVVRKSIELTRATPGQLRAALWFSGKRIPLVDFGARQTATGVTYRLGRGSALHAFLATMRSGHAGVFRRRNKARLPIAELRGPSLARVFGNHLPDYRILSDMLYRKNLAHEVDFLTSAAEPTAAGPAEA